MALDLNIGGEVEQTITQTVTTTETRINIVSFDLNNTRAWLSISFGNKEGEVFKVEKTETWAVQKEYYAALILDNTSNGTIADEVLTKVGGAVAEILTSRKDELLLSKELYIFEGELLNHLNNLIPEEEVALR